MSDTQEEAAAAYDMAAIEYRGATAVTNFDISNYIDRLNKKGITPLPMNQANHQETNLVEAKQETESTEAKEEPRKEVKQYTEKPQEKRNEEYVYKEEEAVTTCCIDSSTIIETDRSSDSNEMPWNFYMMDSMFDPFLTDQKLSPDETFIEYPELFNEIGFEDNIEFMFGNNNDCLSLENVDDCMSFAL
ncbi:unnamed protein product [Cochlearia groenlandica]